MTAFGRPFPTSGCAVLALAAACACAARAESGASAAIDAPQPGWKVVHCGVSRGVLYVTYIERGAAAITPAFATAAILQACADAGYPVGASAPARTLPVLPGPRTGAATPPAPRPPRATTRVEPTFTTQASGSVIAIDGRNDGDTAYRCALNFSWTFDDDPAGPRAVTAQATLAGRQVNRVVFISGPYRNVRFVGLPSWHCNAAD